jgi:hypothetical protein
MTDKQLVELADLVPFLDLTNAEIKRLVLWLMLEEAIQERLAEFRQS